jgi:hypothetical protein
MSLNVLLSFFEIVLIMYCISSEKKNREPDLPGVPTIASDFSWHKENKKCSF